MTPANVGYRRARVIKRVKIFLELVGLKTAFYRRCKKAIDWVIFNPLRNETHVWPVKLLLFNRVALDVLFVYMARETGPGTLSEPP